MRYILILTIIFFFIRKENYAQSLPANDPNWTQVKFDDFNSFNSSDWSSGYWGNSTPVNNGLEYNSSSNVLFNNVAGQTYLSIKCEKLTTPILYTSGDYSPYYYKSGAVYSNFQYKYGYWEISAKMPAGYQGYWPAFWLLAQGPNSCITPPNDGYYNEIDNIENSGGDSQFTDSYGLNYHWRDLNTCNRMSYGETIMPARLQINGNITNENKYGLFWEPGKMTWYFNDVPVRTIIDPVYTPDHAMSTIINFAIDPYNPPDIYTFFPANFEINYLKIWQLQADCNTSVSFCSNFNATSWNSISKVKKTITIGGAGCTDNISTSSNVNFWATDYILISEGTTITDNGSGSFSAIITNCPN